MAVTTSEAPFQARALTGTSRCGGREPRAKPAHGEKGEEEGFLKLPDSPVIRGPSRSAQSCQDCDPQGGHRSDSFSQNHQRHHDCRALILKVALLFALMFLDRIQQEVPENLFVLIFWWRRWGEVKWKRTYHCRRIRLSW